MADRQARQRPLEIPSDGGSVGRVILRWMQDCASNSSQMAWFLTLAILVLTGLTVTCASLGLAVLSPMLLLTSPVWVPVATMAFVLIAGAGTAAGAAVAAAAGATWLYRYFSGLHPVGSDRVDYARSRIVDTASHVKDYAREYGGYIQGRFKDAAPGA